MWAAIVDAYSTVDVAEDTAILQSKVVVSGWNDQVLARFLVMGSVFVVLLFGRCSRFIRFIRK